MDKNGDKFLTHFPSKEGLAFVVSKTKIACRDFKVGFKVRGWRRGGGGDKDDQAYLFPISARIAIHGISIHYWNRTDISKLLMKYAHVLDISEQTSKKLSLQECVWAVRV